LKEMTTQPKDPVELKTSAESQGTASSTPGQAASAGNQAQMSGFPKLWRILTYFDTKKMSPALALRNTAGVVIPLAAGYLLGMPRAGLATASGALNVSYSDGHDPYAQRAKRMLVSTLWCSLAVLLGGITGHHNVIAVMIVSLWAFSAGMLVSLGTTPADVGVISTVTLVVYAAQPLTREQAAISSALAFAGGILQTGLSIALWPVRKYEPERRALGTLFEALAEAANRPLQALSAPPATIESTRAQEALAGLGRDETVEGVRYRAILNQAERIRLSVTMLTRLRARMEREKRPHDAIEIIDKYLGNAALLLRDIGNTLLTAKPNGLEKDRLTLSVALAYQIREDNLGERGSFLAAVVRDARYQMDALSGQLRAAIDLTSRTTPEGEAAMAKEEARQPLWLRFGSRLATLRGNLNLHSVAFRHAVRLAACVALGDTLGRSFDWRRSYWIPMTVVVVLKPEFATTFSRGILRIAGTIAGVLLATALFHFLPIHTVMEIVLIGLFMFLMRWVGPANYGVFALAVSALVVLLLAVNGVSPKEVIAARGVNTVLGGALALLAYAVWPSWERRRVSELFARLLDAYCASFRSIMESYLNPGRKSARERARARQNARTARSNLEASLDRVGVEPGTTSEQMSRWNAMLANSHRFAHAMMAIEAGVSRAQGARPRPEFQIFARDVEKMLALLAEVLREGHVAERMFPDLREDYMQLVGTTDAQNERYALVNVEADRITNSLNSLRENVIEQARAGSAR
jgi:uncharacterized membrane protein YccC